MHVPGSPRLRKGESVLLFLTKRGGHNWVLGMNQGVFDLATTSSGKRQLRQRLAGAALVRKTSNGVREVRAPAISEELHSFVKRVRRLKLRCDKEQGKCRVR